MYYYMGGWYGYKKMQRVTGSDQHAGIMLDIATKENDRSITFRTQAPGLKNWKKAKTVE